MKDIKSEVKRRFNLEFGGNVYEFLMTYEPSDTYHYEYGQFANMINIKNNLAKQISNITTLQIQYLNLDDWVSYMDSWCTEMVVDHLNSKHKNILVCLIEYLMVHVPRYFYNGWLYIMKYFVSQPYGICLESFRPINGLWKELENIIGITVKNITTGISISDAEISHVIGIFNKMASIFPVPLKYPDLILKFLFSGYVTPDSHLFTIDADTNFHLFEKSYDLDFSDFKEKCFFSKDVNIVECGFDSFDDIIQTIRIADRVLESVNKTDFSIDTNTLVNYLILMQGEEYGNICSMWYIDASIPQIRYVVPMKNDMYMAYKESDGNIGLISLRLIKENTVQTYTANLEILNDARIKKFEL
ncbi:MAG TPA: hypothetical protein DCW90_00830 [Lachnospiraceae bacterium]|nr:hypothetical protein [Lachnospiraceae bacterium]